MATFILRRLVESVPVLLLASVVVFSMLHLVPGDPVELMLGSADAGMSEKGSAVAQQVRQDLGLDQPLPIQYVRWLAGAAHGDEARARPPRLTRLEGGDRRARAPHEGRASTPTAHGTGRPRRAPPSAQPSPLHAERPASPERAFDRAAHRPRLRPPARSGLDPQARRQAHGLESHDQHHR